MALTRITAGILSWSFAVCALSAPNFVGRFKPDTFQCNDGLEKADTVFGRVVQDSTGMRVVTFIPFGILSNGVAVTARLGTGSRQSPILFPASYGQVIESWQQVYTATGVTSVLRYESLAPHMNYVKTTTVEDLGKTITIEELTERSGSLPEKTYCRLIR